MFIFMEYCTEGTLEDRAKEGLTEPLIRCYTRELVIAVEHLHERNIIHRDIKGKIIQNIDVIETSYLYSGTRLTRPRLTQKLA